MNDVPRRKMAKSSEPDLLQSLAGANPPLADDAATARPRPLRAGTFGVLDIGSSKICCLIGRVEADGALRVIGTGLRAARGIRAGGIVDLDRAFESIQGAVAEAEQKASHRIDSVTVNLSCGQPASRLFTVEWPVGGRIVTERDIRAVVHEGVRRAQSSGRDSIHVLPLSFAVDDTQGVADPRDMHCHQLSARLHVIDAAGSAISNLMATLDRCSLTLKELVSAPLAAGLATLVEDEQQLGATVIDMGGGSTGLAVFSEGHVLHTDLLRVGGHHVTNDIARGMTAPVSEAERLKTLYGSAQPSPDDDRETISYQLVGEADHDLHRAPRSEIIRIIRPRLEETFEMVRASLEQAGIAREAGNRVVLTGGASQLPGVRELAAQLLDRQVRLGRPAALRGLPEIAQGPAFATAAGLLSWASGGGRQFADLNLEDDSKPTFLRRIINFLVQRL